MEAGRPPKPLVAVVETGAVAAAYIAVSLAAVRAFDLAAMFPATWTPAERTVGSGFLVGAVVQVLIVLLAGYVFRLPDVTRAVIATFSPSTGRAWTIAVIATTIHIATIILMMLPEPERAWEASSLNLILTLVPLPDGWSQEVFFRGYVLFRLARGGVSGPGQVLASGACFAAIHIGYTGNDFWAVLSPLVGTFMLGCFYAWAVQVGRGSLRPVVLGHMAIIGASQPWLALAR